jgi:ABC-2 type transport system ATP-binding protein
MLIIKGLTVSYGEHVVLEELNLSLEEKQVHGLMGLNGSGKTTLLNAMLGIVPRDSGEVTFNSAPFSSSMTGYLETVNFFYPKITGGEYLGLFKWKNNSFDIESWNKVFELPLGELIETYSTGMKKKLALLGILSLGREVLFLDEPFNGLDLEANLILSKIILLLKESGKTILLTSHVLSSLFSVCGKIHYLNNKKIERSFKKEEFEAINELVLDKHLKDKVDLAGTLIK